MKLTLKLKRIKQLGDSSRPCSGCIFNGKKCDYPVTSANPSTSKDTFCTDDDGIDYIWVISTNKEKEV